MLSEKLFAFVMKRGRLFNFIDIPGDNGAQTKSVLRNDMDFAPLSRTQEYRVTKVPLQRNYRSILDQFLATSFSSHYQIDKWKYSTYCNAFKRPLT